MKTSLGLIGATLVVCANAASAQNIVINTGAYSSNSGGEFNATLSNTALVPTALTNSGSFETFCLERTENFQPGATYLFDVSASAIAGGGGAANGADPLDERSAYLYSLFINGVLPTYDYTNGNNDRQGDAAALQNVLWYIEEEVGTLDSAKAVFFFNLSQNAVGQGIGNVVVLNVYSIDDNGGRVERQSQIALIPAPSAGALMAAGSLLALRRRR